jgi:DNA-binding NtrC family response regulator
MAHVVIVDDEEVVRGTVEQIVSMLGWTFESAANGILGLQIIERVAPDLVITNAGIWERIFEVLLADPENTYVMIDSTIVRAHQQAVCGKGGTKTRLWGVPEEE